MRLDDLITPTTPGEVFDAIRRALPDLHREGALVLLAQWAIETGRGAETHRFNVGNVKSNGRSGDWCFFPTAEVIDGRLQHFEPDHPQCRFAAYGDLDEGVNGYLLVVRQRFDRAWPFVLAGDPRGFVHALKNPPPSYFTAQEGPYADTVARLVAEFRATGAIGAGFDLHAPRGQQAALRALGFDPGGIDGIVGPKTRGAARAFQREAGLMADGIIGPRTIVALAEALARRDA